MNGREACPLPGVPAGENDNARTRSRARAERRIPLNSQDRMDAPLRGAYGLGSCPITSLGRGGCRMQQKSVGAFSGGEDDAGEDGGRPSLTDGTGYDCRGRRTDVPREEVQDGITEPPVTGLPPQLSDGSGIGMREESMSGRRGKTSGAHLLQEIRALEFAIVEVVLYLDAYPCDGRALKLYHRLMDQRAPLVAEYEASVGPLTAFGNVSRCSWDWVNKPFPWEREANR